MLSEQIFCVLNAIYLRKMATPAHVADVTGYSLATVTRILEKQAEAERVISINDAFLMQPEGVQKVLEYYHHAYQPMRESAGVIEWYERFEQTLNVQLIKAVSDWQTSEGDDRARERMVRIVERMIRALSELVTEIPRYAAYIQRFERAMALADKGQLDYVCNPTLDSMHNIWFEFHEDILAVVGRPRDV
ncbi:hypothetical protein [Pseudomonas fluorescens]